MCAQTDNATACFQHRQLSAAQWGKFKDTHFNLNWTSGISLNQSKNHTVNKGR